MQQTIHAIIRANKFQRSKPAPKFLCTIECSFWNIASTIALYGTIATICEREIFLRHEKKKKPNKMWRIYGFDENSHNIFSRFVHLCKIMWLEWHFLAIRRQSIWLWCMMYQKKKTNCEWAPVGQKIKMFHRKFDIFVINFVMHCTIYWL